MSKIPEHYRKLQEQLLQNPNFDDKLNEALDDVGVNNEMIQKRRRNALLHENIETVMTKLKGYKRTSFHFGSRSEGTTTNDLQSDVDSLYFVEDVKVVQSIQEFRSDIKVYKKYLLMIQDDDVTPGYCHLEVLNEKLRRSTTDLTEVNDHYVRGKDDRIMYKNTIMENFMPGQGVRHGPAWAEVGQKGIADRDTVAAFHCKSWPYQARDWLNRSRVEGWPSEELKRKCIEDGFFVVPTGSSPEKELEWRISTSLAERRLMFSLNITQVRCYILMKMIIKSSMTEELEGKISSFMCKSVLLQCIEGSVPYDWKESNLSKCLDRCLQVLMRCVQEENCPHFIIPRNNLMAGKFSTKVKSNILGMMGYILGYTRLVLARGIRFDDLSMRLREKIGMNTDFSPTKPLEVNNRLKAALLVDTAVLLQSYQRAYLIHTCEYYWSLEFQEMFQRQSLKTLDQLINQEDEIQKEVYSHLEPFLSSLLGSTIASRTGIESNLSECCEAEALLKKGCDADVSSGRLKLASIFYCSGKIGRTKSILRETEVKYDRRIVETICNCDVVPFDVENMNFAKFQDKRNQVVKNVVAYCVMFIPAEMKWIPKELQNELYRLTYGRFVAKSDITWMNWAVVDSLPYLYFLQYKVYKHFHDQDGQQMALSNLQKVIDRTRNLGHRETALNLLGQCLEENNEPIKALQCYSRSLRLRPDYNAARILICICLAKLLQKEDHTTIIYQRQSEM